MTFLQTPRYGGHIPWKGLALMLALTVATVAACAILTELRAINARLDQIERKGF